MLVFSRFKAALIIGVCLLGVALSIPSLVPPGVSPAWLPRVNLGLDLQGGSYLLLEIDCGAIVKEKLVNTREQIVQILREDNIRGATSSINAHSITVNLPNQSGTAAHDALKSIVAERTGRPRALPIWVSQEDGDRMTLTLNDDAVKMLANDAVAQSIPIVRRRMDETGVNEPVVARQGQGRIMVELPGVSDPGPDQTPARLDGEAELPSGYPRDERWRGGDRAASLCRRGHQGQAVNVRKQISMDGTNLKNASALLDKNAGGWAVHFQLDYTGTKRFADLTSKHVGEPFAIVLDGKVISAPVIREPIVGGQGQISGSFSAHEAYDLAVLMRAGALPAPLKVIEERTIGASLGPTRSRPASIPSWPVSRWWSR